jgi:NAD(P)-dependent dehydrogenase (short-subunit alcohol dehydrogenase family)
LRLDAVMGGQCMREERTMESTTHPRVEGDEDRLWRWDRRFAVITGGTQGLGEATARLLARRGAGGLVISGRNAERGKSVAGELDSLGCPTEFVQADLADVDACAAVVHRADDTFGTVHALINCAASADRSTVWSTSPELWDEMIAVNTRAPFFLAQATARIMRRDGIEGSITNVISMAAYGGQPYITAYAISKGALIALTRNLAFSLLPNRIRVNALCPGWMATPGEDATQRRFHGAEDGWLERASSRQPFGRLIDPSEAARALAFLASDESGLMTGAIVDYDQTVRGAGEEPALPNLRRAHGDRIPTTAERSG